MQTSEMLTKQSNILKYCRNRHQLPKADGQQAYQDLKALFAEIYDTENYEFALQFIDKYWQAMEEDMREEVLDETEEKPIIREISHQVEIMRVYLRDECFHLPNASGYIDDYCWMYDNKIIKRYNPVTKKVDTVFPSYVEDNNYIVDIKTGHITHRFDLRNDRMIPVPMLLPTNQTPTAATTPDLQPPLQSFCGALDAEHYRKILKNLITGGFLPAQTNNEVWLYICGAKPRRPAEMRPIQWLNSVGLLSLLIKSLFDSTPYKWQIGAQVFVDKARKPINPSTLRAFPSQIENSDRERPKDYEKMMKAIQI